MKIDRESLVKSRSPSPQDRDAVSPQRLPAQSARSWSPTVLVTLLVLAFGAGILVARVLNSPALDSNSASVPLSPLPPAAIVPSPTPAPTPTTTSLDTGDVLETVYIDVLPTDMDKIIAKREEALQLGILLATGSDYVPGTIRVGSDPSELQVELRLKGDWVDHIIQDKWSFRVRTLGVDYLFGMRVFSLHDPSMRSFLNEWLFLENLRLEDVLAVRYYFVHVVLNGEYQGIYALEEGFSKELFEAQERREGLIIRYDEDLVWEYRAYYDDQLVPRGVNQFYIIHEFESGRIGSDPALAAQRDTAIGLLRGLWTGERTAAEVFDLETMGLFLALSDLWSAPHGLIWHNLRYYYNPITAQLEPIAFDSDALAGELEMAGLPPSAFYHDTRLQAAYLRELWRISRPGYIEALQARVGAQHELLQAALESEFGSDVLTAPWDLLRRRQELLQQTLDPYRTVYAYVQRSYLENPTSVVPVDVGNLLDLPVEIIGLEINGAYVPASGDWVAAESVDLVVHAPGEASNAIILQPLPPDATFMDYVHLRIPQATLVDAFVTGAPEIKIVTRLWGLTEQHVDEVLPDYPSPLAQGPRPELPTVAQAMVQHPYLQSVSDEKMLYIDSGTWEVNGDLVLPDGYGLRLAPGTTLRFGHNHYLLATGPLDFQGTAAAPILLQPASMDGNVAAATDAQWSGLVVLDAGAPSIWNYVTVERASALEKSGWQLTGGITFYRSPIRLARSRILESRAEDAINVVRSEFDFVHSEFAGSVSDAFDADFGQGSIENCSFHDIGGDGIDLSGSRVRVQHVKLFNVADKGISVGENSQLEAYDVYLDNVGLGVVSKDLSRAKLVDATMVNVQTAGLAAYMKKAAYGPASLSASNIHFTDTPSDRYTLVQTGSWIELEGRRISGTYIDVDALYQRQGE